MKKIVAILWHNSANRMRVLREEVEKIADVRIFSAGSLGDGEEDINDLYAAIDQADLLLLNETASDPIWKEINEYIKNSTLPMVYVGGEAATHVKTPQQAKWTAFANAYYTYGGAENTLNMLRFLCAEVLGEAMPYEEVKRIPWDAIFAPDGNTLYDSPESYFVDYPRSNKGTIALVISRSAFNYPYIIIKSYIVTAFKRSYRYKYRAFHSPQSGICYIVLHNSTDICAFRHIVTIYNNITC